jgi:hypothetical protein
MTSNTRKGSGGAGQAIHLQSRQLDTTDRTLPQQGAKTVHKNNY